MYFDNIVKQAKASFQEQRVFADKDEEMFVSIFKAEGDDNDTGESLENPDDTGAGGESPDAGGANDSGTGESLENPDGNGNPDGGDQGADNGNDNGTGESLENPGEGNQDDGSGNADQGGGQGDQGAGESLENPDAAGGQDPNAAQPQQDPNQQQQNPEDEAEKKIKDINERIQLFRKHRKLEDTVQVLYQSVSSAIGQVVTADNRIKLIRIQKDLLVTKGQLEYAISLDFKTINMEKAEEIYKVLEKKVALMSDTLKKIRKENAEA
jgi:hypothetical protein